MVCALKYERGAAVKCHPPRCCRYYIGAGFWSAEFLWSFWLLKARAQLGAGVLIVHTALFERQHRAVLERGKHGTCLCPAEE